MTQRTANSIFGPVSYTTIWLDMGPGGTAWSGTGVRHVKNGPWNDANEGFCLSGHRILGYHVDGVLAGADQLRVELALPHPQSPTSRVPAFVQNNVAGITPGYVTLDASSLPGTPAAVFVPAHVPDFNYALSWDFVIPGPVKLDLVPTYASGNGPTLRKLDLVTIAPTHKGFR